MNLSADLLLTEMHIEYMFPSSTSQPLKVRIGVDEIGCL